MFNFHIDSLDHPDVVKFTQLFHGMNLCQHVKGSAHIHGHTLDIAITRSCEEYLVSAVEICAPTMFTQLDPLILNCHIDKPAAQKKIIECRILMPKSPERKYSSGLTLPGTVRSWQWLAENEDKQNAATWSPSHPEILTLLTRRELATTICAEQPRHSTITSRLMIVVMTQRCSR